MRTAVLLNAVLASKTLAHINSPMFIARKWNNVFLIVRPSVFSDFSWRDHHRTVLTGIHQLTSNCSPNWTTLTTMSNESKNHFMRTWNVLLIGQVVIMCNSFVLTCLVLWSWPQGNVFYILTFWRRTFFFKF